MRHVRVLLWVVNLCGISAATLCYIHLAHHLYTVSGSVLLSQAVLLGPMVLPVLFVGAIHRAAGARSPRTVLLAANAASLAVVAVVYTGLPHRPELALAGGVLVGALDALQRVARIVAIKRYFAAADLGHTVPLTLTAQFIAGGIAGAAMAMFRDDMTPAIALAATGVAFAAAAAAAAALPRLPSPGHPAPRLSMWPAFRDALAASASLRHGFAAFVLLVTVFQGFFNVSRVALPAHVLGLSQSWVGALQAVNSVAALAGAVAYWAWARRGDRRLPAGPMAAVSGAFMLAAAAGTGVVPSYAAYFFYIVFFELAFFRLQADIVRDTPPDRMAAVAALQYAAVYAGMLGAIAVGSLALDRFGLLATAAAFLAFYAVASFAGRWRARVAQHGVAP